MYADALNPYVNIPLLVQPVPGATFVNPAKYEQKIFHLVATDYPVTLASGGRGRTTFLPPADQGGDGDTELHYLMAESTGKFSVQLNLTTLNRRLMNGPVESSLVFGSGVLPGRMLAPVYIPATTSLDVELVDLSAGSNTVRMVGIGHQILNKGVADQIRRQRLMDMPFKHPFWLTFDAGAEQTLSGSSTEDSYNCTVPSIADFNCWGMLFRIENNDATIEIFEGNRRRLMNSAVRLSQIAGQTLAVTGFPNSLVQAAGLPMYWPFSHVFKRGTVVNLRVKATGGTPKLSVAFVGELVYYPEGSAQTARWR